MSRNRVLRLCAVFGVGAAFFFFGSDPSFRALIGSLFAFCILGAIKLSLAATTCDRCGETLAPIMCEECHDAACGHDPACDGDCGET